MSICIFALFIRVDIGVSPVLILSTLFTLPNDSFGSSLVKTATEVGVRAIQDHKVIEWNTCWKCRLSEGTGDK